MDVVAILISDMVMNLVKLLQGHPVIFVTQLHPLQAPLNFPQLLMSLFPPLGRIRRSSIAVHVKTLHGTLEPRRGSLCGSNQN